MAFDKDIKKIRRKAILKADDKHIEAFKDYLTNSQEYQRPYKLALFCFILACMILAFCLVVLIDNVTLPEINIHKTYTSKQIINPVNNITIEKDIIYNNTETTIIEKRVAPKYIRDCATIEGSDKIICPGGI